VRFRGVVPRPPQKGAPHARSHVHPDSRPCHCSRRVVGLASRAQCPVAVRAAPRFHITNGGFEPPISPLDALRRHGCTSFGTAPGWPATPTRARTRPRRQSLQPAASARSSLQPRRRGLSRSGYAARGTPNSFARPLTALCFTAHRRPRHPDWTQFNRALIVTHPSTLTSPCPTPRRSVSRRGHLCVMPRAGPHAPRRQRVSWTAFEFGLFNDGPSLANGQRYTSRELPHRRFFVGLRSPGGRGSRLSAATPRPWSTFPSGTAGRPSGLSSRLFDDQPRPL